ncbi:hypothetical protein CE91St63_21530 [[Clostridium] hylemonae]|nr:hypothetical protein CE91St63_21530 [[Clostridium] hylemonae]
MISGNIDGKEDIMKEHEYIENRDKLMREMDNAEKLFDETKKRLVDRIDKKMDDALKELLNSKDIENMVKLEERLRMFDIEMQNLIREFFE